LRAPAAGQAQDDARHGLQHQRLIVGGQLHHGLLLVLAPRREDLVRDAEVHRFEMAALGRMRKRKRQGAIASGIDHRNVLHASRMRASVVHAVTAAKPKARYGNHAGEDAERGEDQQRLGGLGKTGREQQRLGSARLDGNAALLGHDGEGEHAGAVDIEHRDQGGTRHRVLQRGRAG
jgi:hypothetical protein